MHPTDGAIVTYIRVSLGFHASGLAWGRHGPSGSRSVGHRRRGLWAAIRGGMHRALYIGIWLLLLGEALLLSPPPRPDQGEWVVRLLTGDWGGEETSVVALFQLMGVWPLAMAALLAPRLRRAPVPLWPFVLGSMALGAFVLLPGLALGGGRQPVARWQAWAGHRVVVGGLGCASVGLLIWAVGSGRPSAFVEAWRHEQFVHVMTHDFVALWLTSIVAAHEQGEARWWWTLWPLVGGLALRGWSPVEAEAA